MRTLVIGIVSFVLGLGIAGFVAMKFLVFGGQSVALTEIKFYTTALMLIQEGNVEELTKRSCHFLPIAIENKEFMSNSLFSSDIAEPTTYPTDGLESVKSIDSLANQYLSDDGICSRFNNIGN